MCKRVIARNGLPGAVVFLAIGLVLHAGSAEPPKSNREQVNAAYLAGHKLWAEGRLADAVPHVEEAVKLAGQAPDYDSLPRGDLHNRLGILYYETSQFALAEAQFRRALALREAALDSGDDLVIECVNNLAIQLKEQGSFEQAEKHLRRALEAQEKRRPSEPVVADYADNLGFILDKLGRHDEAAALFNRALGIRERNSGPESRDAAQSLRNLAEVAERAGKRDEARQKYTRSLELFKKHFGSNHRKVAISLNSLAGLEMADGKPAKAVELLEQCAAIMRAKMQSDDPEVSLGLVLENLASAFGSQGEWAKAADAMDEAQRAYLRYVGFSLPSQPEADQLTFLATAFEPTLHHGLSLGLAAKSDPRIRDLSAGWVLNGKAVGHRVLVERASLAKDASVPEAAALTRELNSVRAERARVRYLSLRETGDDLARRGAELTAREEKLVRQLGEIRGRITSGTLVPVAAVREAIPADTVLVEISRFRRFSFQGGLPLSEGVDVYAAWIIPPVGGGELQLIDLGPAVAIDDAVWDVRTAVERAPRLSAGRDEHAAEKDAANALDRLSRSALHPLLPAIKSARRWIICPDSDLWLVPWAALRQPNGRYVVEDYEISHALAGRDLIRSKQVVRPSAPVVMADPDFDLGDSPAEGKGVKSILWERLPGTATEAKSVAAALSKAADQRVEVLTRERATEQAFKRLANPRFLVLSTHGFFLDDRPSASAPFTRSGSLRGLDLKSEPGADVRRPRPSKGSLDNPLLRCGLVLAGANRFGGRPDVDDGMLTGLEIVATDFRGTELVVLSACQTGVGQVHRGEGVSGLRQAFLQAGAKSVAATLWKVPDLETVELVEGFVEQIGRRASAPSALRAGQLRVIARRRAAANGAAHPYYWAAFTLTGF
jgi:CHAT domain-containing protein/Tfp pilus assembly protein PilF